jgi:adenylate cyclase
MSDDTIQKLAILYADVSGSTHIYEKYGDTIARQNIETCISILSEVASSLDGDVVKTIGDEAMCKFPNAVKAAKAATAMHEALQLASEQGQFSIGEVHVKIGWHYGPVRYRGKELIGEAPIIAQQIINLAKKDEILTSSQSIDALPEELKYNARFINSVEADAWDGELKVYGLPWEEEEEVTRIGSLPSASTEDDETHKALLLDYGDKHIRLDSEHTHCLIGRGDNNDLCIDGKFTSKSHAEITYRHGVFHLQDNSTNGTAVYFANGRNIRLHREEEMLGDHGTIYFGGTPLNDPHAGVIFRCHRI